MVYLHNGILFNNTKEQTIEEKKKTQWISEQLCWMKEARRMIIVCIWFHIELHKMQIYLEIWESRSEVAWAWGVGVLVVGWQGQGGTEKAGKENYKGPWGNFEGEGYVQCGDGFMVSTNVKTYQTVYFKYVYFTIRQLYKNKRLRSWPSQCCTLYNVNVNDSSLLEFSLPTVWKEMIPQALHVLSAWLHQGSLIPAVVSLWWSQALPISLKTWKTGKAPSWQPLRRPQWYPCPNHHPVYPTARNQPWLCVAAPDQPVPFASFFSLHQLVFGQALLHQPLGTWAAGLILDYGLASQTGRTSLGKHQQDIQTFPPNSHRWNVSTGAPCSRFPESKAKPSVCHDLIPAANPDSLNPRTSGSILSELGLKIPLPLRTGLTPISTFGSYFNLFNTSAHLSI